ncbi:hypothetical protein VB714_25795, partial [Spirulina sp. 06S082]
MPNFRVSAIFKYSPSHQGKAKMATSGATYRNNRIRLGNAHQDRRLTFRLYPNQIQCQTLLEARRLHAYLYNACLAHRRFEWRKNRKSIDY